MYNPTTICIGALKLVVLFPTPQRQFSSSFTYYNNGLKQDYRKK